MWQQENTDAFIYKSAYYTEQDARWVPLAKDMSFDLKLLRSFKIQDRINFFHGSLPQKPSLLEQNSNSWWIS